MKFDTHKEMIFFDTKIMDSYKFVSHERTFLPCKSSHMLSQKHFFKGE